MDPRQSQSASLQDAPEDLSIKEGNSSNNSNTSALRQHLDQPPPSGLSLLVAALDAQNHSQHESRSRHELAMDSSNSEASTSPTPSMMADSSGGGDGSRRRPIPDVHKDETYWEKRRRNNDAAKRSREKRRLNDMVMEQRLLELSKENSLLKNELHSSRLPPSPVIVAPKIEPALPTATTPLLFSASQPAVLDMAGAPAAKIPNLSLFTNNGGGNLSGAMVSNNQHLNNLATSQNLNLATGQSLHSAAGQNLNLPPNLLHPSLFASALPPHPMLQLYQAQIQAALAAQQQQNRSSSTGLLSVGNGSAFQPFSNGNGHLEQQQHVSPDSSTVDGAKLTNGVDQSSSCLDGKQYLRYKLLERQNRRSSSDSLDNIPNQQPSTHSSNDQSSSSATNNDRPQSLLGSLLSNRRSSPSVLQSRTERESGLATTSSSSSSSSAPSLNTDLKHCLSSLAVHLTTAKSDSSDSMASPSSSRGAESTNSSQSHPSPSGTTENGAILKALRSKIGSGENVSDRYVERRKRNNEAAKRCRANRRALFEFRFKRTQQLENENSLLRDDIEQLTKEVLQLKEQLLMQQQRSVRLDTAGRCDADYLAALPTQAAVQKSEEMLDMTSHEQEAAGDDPAEHSTSPSADSGHHDSGSDADEGAKLSIAEPLN